MSRSKFFYRSTFSVLLVIFTLYLSGCQDDENEVPKPEFVKLNESSKLFDRSLSEIEAFVTIAGLEELKQYLSYDISVYTITYKTDYLGQEILASGLVAFPKTDEAMPMLSFQHGTIVKHSDAPTVDNSTSYGTAGVASAGYIFLIPDYIGFGSSSNLLHPYYRADITATTVMDMMIAAQELAVQEGFKFNGKAFLAGYSEGGFATLATHRAMEAEGLEGFELVASAPAAGAYDIKGMQEHLFNLEEYSDPFYIAYVALSYKTTYGWDQPLSDFFLEPYATKIPQYFDGTISGDSINKLLPTKVGELLNPDFRANIDTDPKYADMLEAFEENSVVNWAPKAKVYMYHGSADQVVPYQNSLDTYTSLINAGASNENVQLFRLEGAGHGSGFATYLRHVIPLFEALK